jgi:hypothetical protein
LPCDRLRGFWQLARAALAVSSIEVTIASKEWPLDSKGIETGLTLAPINLVSLQVTNTSVGLACSTGRGVRGAMTPLSMGGIILLTTQTQPAAILRRIDHWRI